jgi:uncharacterized protein
MRMSAERRLAAPRETVWEALNDVDTLRTCIPGCEKLERLADGRLAAAVRARIGPVSTAFTGTISLSDLDPPNSYTIAGEGQGGPAGFANGRATVQLTPDGAGTVLTYDVEATVGGKLAQIGSRLIDAAARKMADDFFARFAGAVVAAPSEAHALVVQDERTGLRPVVWVPVLIAVVLLGLFIASRL